MCTPRALTPNVSAAVAIIRACARSRRLRVCGIGSKARCIRRWLAKSCAEHAPHFLALCGISTAPLIIGSPSSTFPLPSLPFNPVQSTPPRARRRRAVQHAGGACSRPRLASSIAPHVLYTSTLRGNVSDASGSPHARRASAPAVLCDRDSRRALGANIPPRRSPRRMDAAPPWTCHVQSTPRALPLRPMRLARDLRDERGKRAGSASCRKPAALAVVRAWRQAGRPRWMPALYACGRPRSCCPSARTVTPRAPCAGDGQRAHLRNALGIVMPWPFAAPASTPRTPALSCPGALDGVAAHSDGPRAPGSRVEDLG
ncbi:hypothetical protein FB451DRAFT_1535579 [Mycena latifolia]|nr:hypothetical protein FB451DRAFT_1535579 [Mycena latifolia]